MTNVIDQAASRDFISDVTRVVLYLLRFLMALGIVECANRIFGLVEIIHGALGLFTSSAYVFAVFVVASIVVSATDRIFGASLVRLQSFASQSLRISQGIKDGHQQILGKLGRIENIKGSTKFSVFFTLPIYFAVIAVVRIYDGFSGYNENIFQMVLFCLLSGFLAAILMLVVGSVVAGRLAQRQRNAPHGS